MFMFGLSLNIITTIHDNYKLEWMLVFIISIIFNINIVQSL